MHDLAAQMSTDFGKTSAEVFEAQTKPDSTFDKVPAFDFAIIAII